MASDTAVAEDPMAVEKAVPFVLPQLGEEAVARQALLPDSDMILVQRGLLRDILKDGTCPLHLRMQLERAIAWQQPAEPAAVPSYLPSPACSPAVGSSAVPQQAAEPAGESPNPSPTVGDAASSELPQRPKEEDEEEEEQTKLAVSGSASFTSVWAALSGCLTAKEDQPEKKVLQKDTNAYLDSLTVNCMAKIVAMLSLPEIVAFRTTHRAGLSCAMERAIAGHPELARVHNRIRARLWIQRVSDLTKDTADETIFETQVRSFANDALRRRMEAEMGEAKLHMERQIYAFQGEVDRRMEEQALRVHAIVEERVQQQLDTILAAEMEKVRALVEERVQERVRAVVQREVRATVCEVHVRLAALARENDRLRTVFAEHSDICFRSLVWAMSPSSAGLFARGLRALWCCRRRASGMKSWLFGLPPDKRHERLRQRLEQIRNQRASIAGAEPGEEPQSSMTELRSLWGPELEEMRKLLLTPISTIAEEGGLLISGITEEANDERNAAIHGRPNAAAPQRGGPAAGAEPSPTPSTAGTPASPPAAVAAVAAEPEPAPVVDVADAAAATAAVASNGAAPAAPLRGLPVRQATPPISSTAQAVFAVVDAADAARGGGVRVPRRGEGSDGVATAADSESALGGEEEAEAGAANEAPPAAASAEQATSSEAIAPPERCGREVGLLDRQGNYGDEESEEFEEEEDIRRSRLGLAEPAELDSEEEMDPSPLVTDVEAEFPTEEEAISAALTASAHAEAAEPVKPASPPAEEAETAAEPVPEAVPAVEEPLPQAPDPLPPPASTDAAETAREAVQASDVAVPASDDDDAEAPQ
eukprot:TRINITY_DN8944_c0_g2_i1.p1 TRINITY_DN8944_c0_g2~~TRINITY_DN8944_c0_g2_i1.p1  ORF type:complete len:821 (+),score=240.09 TRINITY_DN8944_c0_g2_i1:107-2569(+)